MRKFVVVLGALSLGVLSGLWYSHLSADNVVAASAGATLAAGEAADQAPAFGGEGALRGTEQAGTAETAANAIASNEVPAFSTSPASAGGVGSPIDQRFLTNGMLNDDATKALKSKSFARVLAQAQAQSTATTLKSMSDYRAVLEAGLDKQAGSPSIDQIACTPSLCIASIVSNSVASAQSADWARDILESASASTLRIGAWTDAVVPLSGGRAETRLIFTTAPGVSGFVVGAGQGLQKR